MKRTAFAVALATALSTCAQPVPAQSTAQSVKFPAFYAPGMSPCVQQADGTCRPVSNAQPLPVGVQESFQLAAANTPSAPVTLFGGDYILSQTCSGYGTLALQVLGADATTWSPLVTKSTADTAGGSGLSLGSYSVVRVALTGTTGCYANLARVPA